MVCNGGTAYSNIFTFQIVLNIVFTLLIFNQIGIFFFIFQEIILILVLFLKKKNIYLSKFEIKIFVSVLILSLIIGSSYSFIKSKSEINNSITYEEALEISKQNKKNILIDFSAIWCANCFELKEKVFESEELKKFIYDNLIFVEVDVDKRKDIAKEFNIKWLPYIIIIDENKNILYSKNSFSSFDEKIANEIKKDIENIIK